MIYPAYISHFPNNVSEAENQPCWQSRCKEIQNPVKTRRLPNQMFYFTPKPPYHFDPHLQRLCTVHRKTSLMNPQHSSIRENKGEQRALNISSFPSPVVKPALFSFPR